MQWQMLLKLPPVITGNELITWCIILVDYVVYFTVQDIFLDEMSAYLCTGVLFKKSNNRHKINFAQED